LRRKLFISFIFAGLILVAAFFLIPYKSEPSTEVLGTQVVEIEEYTNNINSSDERVVTHGSRNQKKIALTFDGEMTDGMKDNLLSDRRKGSYDARIADILTQTNTKATFFLTGMWIELYPQVTRDLSGNPLLELASHSYTDSSFDGYCYGLKQIPNDEKKHEAIAITQKLLKDVAGFDNRLFRFPGGCYLQKDLDLVNNAGLKVVHWDISGGDGFNQSSASIEQNVLGNVQNGSIIILHLNGSPTAPKTAEALPKIISELKLRGFEFVKVSELL